MNKENIVIVGQQPWDVDIGSNCKNIALEFSKYNRVLYVNSPLDRITSLRESHQPAVKKRKRVVAGKEDGLIQVGEQLWNLYPDCMVESINWIRSHAIFRYLNKINNHRFAGSIRSAMTRLGFTDHILFNDNEIFKAFYLSDLLKPKLSVYYSRDYMLGVDYWKRHGEGLEPLLIAKNDICFSNSVYLANYCRRYNQQAYYVGQGCDLNLSTLGPGTEVPEDLKGYSQTIIGYVGALDSQRLDIEIIGFLARRFPEYLIALVGPEDEVFKASELHQSTNILFLGRKNADQLPAYIQAFDVCINPQKVNAITIGNYPRKIDEYLALGKPVVATRTETMEAFADHVYLADDKGSYVDKITAALVEDCEHLQISRRAFAAGHTWENSVNQMYIAMDDRLNDAIRREGRPG